MDEIIVRQLSIATAITEAVNESGTCEYRNRYSKKESQLIEGLEQPFQVFLNFRREHHIGKPPLFVV